MCEHRNFDAVVEVNRLEDVGVFMADVRITCSECKTPFVFVGIPVGLNFKGDAVSFDGTEARLTIEPAIKREGYYQTRVTSRKPVSEH